MECRQANNLTDVESLEHRLEMATVTVEKILLDPGEVLVSLDLKIAELKELLNAIPDVEIRSKWEARYLAIQEKRNDINNVQVSKRILILNCSLLIVFPDVSI